MLRGAFGEDRGRLAFQIAERADALGAEKLEAPGMDPGEQHDRHPFVERHDQGRREIHADVDLALTQRLRHGQAAGSTTDIFDLIETLCAQQSSARYCGARQADGTLPRRMRFVSGGGSAASNSRAQPIVPTAPTSAKSFTNARRLITLSVPS